MNIESRLCAPVYFAKASVPKTLCVGVIIGEEVISGSVDEGPQVMYYVKTDKALPFASPEILIIYSQDQRYEICKYTPATLDYLTPLMEEACSLPLSTESPGIKAKSITIEGVSVFSWEDSTFRLNDIVTGMCGAMNLYTGGLSLVTRNTSRE